MSPWLDFTVLSSVMKSNTHVSRKKKVTHLKWYPSLKLRMFHIYYTGAATRLPWGKSFLCQLLPLFIHTVTETFPQVINIKSFCSGFTVADGGWPNSLRSRSVGIEEDWSAATQSFEHREVVIFYSPLVASTVGKPFLLSASLLLSYPVTGTCRPDELLTRTNIWRRQLKGGGEQCQTGIL